MKPLSRPPPTSGRWWPALQARQQVRARVGAADDAQEPGEGASLPEIDECSVT